MKTVIYQFILADLTDHFAFGMPCYGTITMLITSTCYLSRNHCMVSVTYGNSSTTTFTTIYPSSFKNISLVS